MKTATITTLIFLLSFANADAAIVNINSKTNRINNPIILTLSAGIYDVTPIGIADGGSYNAWNAWGYTSGCDGNGANCSYGWINKYSINSDQFAEINLYDEIRYANSILALDNALKASFTLTTETPVSFYIRDSFYPDNIGGISLEVTSVPIPGAIWLLGTGLLGLLGFRRKIRQNSHHLHATTE